MRSIPIFFAVKSRRCAARPAEAGHYERRRNTMLHVALWEPEVPPNTGNVARLCAAVGARLHLVGRLGFRLDDKHLKRAGLDYWPAVDLVRHVSFDEFEAAFDGRLWCVDNPADHSYTRADFRDGDGLLFG